MKGILLASMGWVTACRGGNGCTDTSKVPGYAIGARVPSYSLMPPSQTSLDLVGSFDVGSMLPSSEGP